MVKPGDKAAYQAKYLRDHFAGWAVILDRDASLPGPEVELEAARMTATYARNRGYLWVSLRAAFAGHPVLLAQVPDTPGPIDALPFGTARVHVREGRQVRPRRGQYCHHRGPFAMSLLVIVCA